MSFETWLGFARALAIAVAMPWPVAALVPGRVAIGGWRSAMTMGGGVMLNAVCALAAALLGLGAVLATSAAAFAVVKWAGAVYLVWLGIVLWRAPTMAPVSLPTRSGFRDAFVVTVLNPKSIGFFVALVSQFLDPARPYPMQAAIILLTFVGVGGTNVVLSALLAARPGKRVRRPRERALFHHAGGTALASVGVGLAAMRRA